MLYLGKSIKKLKLVNFDLKNLVHWLNANKISLNVKKPNWQSLNLKGNNLRWWNEIKVKSKKLFLADSVKYLRVKIDGVLPWKFHQPVKLNRVNALLFKISFILRTIYLAIFESHLNYCSLVWSQNCNAIVLSIFKKSS